VSAGFDGISDIAAKTAATAAAAAARNANTITTFDLTFVAWMLVAIAAPTNPMAMRTATIFLPIIFRRLFDMHR